MWTRIRENTLKLAPIAAIDIYQPSSKTIDALMKLDLPSGVDIEVKLYQRLSIKRTYAFRDVTAT